MENNIQEIQEKLEKIEARFKNELEKIEERLKITKTDMYLLEIDCLLFKRETIGRNSIQALQFAYDQLLKAKMDMESNIEDLQKFHNFFKTDKAREIRRKPYTYLEYSN